MNALDEKIKVLLGLYSCENCGRCCNKERVIVSPGDCQRNRRLSGAIHSTLIMGYATLKLPCPFISDDDQCTCYSNRPLPCKRYPLFEKYPGYVSISQCPYGDKIIKDLQEFCALNGVATEDADAKESILKMDDMYRKMGVGQKESFMAVSIPMPVFDGFYKWIVAKAVEP